MQPVRRLSLFGTPAERREKELQTIGWSTEDAEEDDDDDGDGTPRGRVGKTRDPRTGL